MASEVLIKTDRIAEAKNVVSQLKQQTEELRGRVNSIKGALEWKVASKEAIDDNLKSICDELDKQIQFMDNASSLCTLVVNSTDETTNALIASISKILLTIVGIAAVVGQALNSFKQIITSGNGATGTDISGTGSQSTTPVPINTTVSGPTKQYVSGSDTPKNKDYSNYKVVNAYDSSVVYSQTDPAWNDPKMNNLGCKICSEAMLYNMKHPDNKVSPYDCRSGNSYACSNQHSVPVSGSNTYDEQSQRNIIAQYVSEGEPIMVRFSNGMHKEIGHSTVVVGIRDGADLNNVSEDDLLMINPSSGKVETIGEYTRRSGRNLDAGWCVQKAK